jgi:hypothetical protein
MPDITMCNGDKCPMRKDCFRFTAMPSGGRQSFFLESPVRIYPTGEYECGEFLERATATVSEVPHE